MRSQKYTRSSGQLPINRVTGQVALKRRAEAAEPKLGTSGTMSSLGSRTGHPVAHGVEVVIKNENLASLADVSFFTASRLLQRWDRKGVVEKSRGKVVIRSPEKLLAA